MSQVDLHSLTLEELANIQKNAAELIKTRQKEEIKNAYVRFQEISKSLGVSIDEIIKAGKGIKNKRPAKYHNPTNQAQTWSGQGRKPQWLEAELAKGKKLDSFLIK